jgi:hypothetical protein
MPFFLLIIITLPLFGAQQAPSSVVKSTTMKEATTPVYQCPDNAKWAAWNDSGGYRLDRAYCECEEGYTGEITENILICDKAIKLPKVNTSKQESSHANI